MSKKEMVSLERRSLVDELHAPAKRNFTRRPVVVKGYDDLWQADIVEMRPYSRSNGGYNYILTVIDVLSKYAWAMPLKTKVGDPVRVSKFKTVFEKGYTPNWSTEVFKIATVQRTNPVTYLIKDYRGDSVTGGFYEYELLKTAQSDVYLVEVWRRKDDKVFVKWLEFDNSHNSWINKDDVL
ncbi:uncharacterized protein [Linepithema humile]|uniref:uncharacterized protein n=1 Tax=Linepithema humile TaxID=83485 RepID=UPI00351EDD47